MAKKTKDKKSKTNSKKSRKATFRDERIRIIAGLLFLAASLTVFISILSYIFTWKSDQSFEWTSDMNNPAVEAGNWAGKLGASVAHLLVNQWFGLASLSISFILVLIGFRFLRIRLLPFWRSVLISIMATIVVSAWLGLFTLNTPILGSGLGGNHGYFISQYLKSLIGTVGTILLLSITSLGVLLYIWPELLKSLSKIFSFNFERKTVKNPESDINTEDDNSDFEKNSSSEDDSDLVFETEFPQQEKQGEYEKFETKINEEPAEEKATEPAEDNNEEDLRFIVDEGKKDDPEGEAKRNLPLEDYDPTLELSDFKLPPIDLLEKHDLQNSSVTQEELISNKNKIVETLGHYKIKIDKIKATIGPTVTLYEIVPAPGVRISRIKSLEDDIALNLSALGIRIIAPIPGKGTIGIEVPNQKPEIVSMRSLLSSRKFQDSKYDLAIALGKTISNETYVFDLAKMPHLLVAGATGQGKSVGLNVILTSLLYRKHPSQLKFVLVDPKKVELTLYQKIEKHYLAKIPDSEETIITDTQKVINTLNSLCIEMDNRYNLLKAAQVRNIKEYNQKFIKRQLNPEKGHQYLPYIVVVVDEFADLIMTAGREVETPLARLAQLARAIGIHLVLATQRPTTNIITGVIKANFPARIAFRVTSMIDSRTILDSPGANQLIGRGDLLFAPGSDLVRLQCAFIDIPELEEITNFIGNQRSYPTPFFLPEFNDDSSDSILDVDLSKKDALFNDAARLIVAHQQGSTSLIQRKFSIGYNRAGRIVDQLEAAGIVGPFEGSKARQVLIPDEYTLEQYLSSLE
ncbi:MAG: DNA translocase FtsK [Bacteroidales bacterium]|nr:DNA translocase FtsK [Bacteroidales bacterium]MBN2819700.1 DNA translocase FtsK [Bacteroidales bacterium]